MVLLENVRCVQNFGNVEESLVLVDFEVGDYLTDFALV